MTLTELTNQPCTIHRSASSPSVRDVYGNASAVETTFDTTCALQQQLRTEQDAVGAGTWLLVLKPDAPIDGGDAVVVGGVRYELVGPPWSVWNPRTGEVHHIEATVRRAAGSEDVAT